MRAGERQGERVPSAANRRHQSTCSISGSFCPLLTSTNFICVAPPLPLPTADRGALARGRAKKKHPYYFGKFGFPGVIVSLSRGNILWANSWERCFGWEVVHNPALESPCVMRNTAQALFYKHLCSFYFMYIIFRPKDMGE